MATPTLKVEIAFDSDPLTASPTWTDVTSYVRNSPGVRISRGRPTELDTFAAGQCSFTLDNRDARFSPLNSSSTYNGKLLPGKQVRITGSYGGTDYRLFRGFITGWPQRYSQGKKDAIVPIVAYDALSKLNEMSVSSFMYGYLTNTIGLLVAYVGSVADRNLVNLVNGEVFHLRSGVATEGDDLAPGLAGSVSLDLAGSSLWQSSTSASGNAGDAHSYSFWMRTSSAGPSSTEFMTVLGTPASDVSIQHIIGVDSAGLLRYEGYDSYTIGFGGTARSTVAVNDGEVHHVAVVRDSTSYVKIFVDGDDVTDTGTGYATDASDGGFGYVAGMQGTNNTSWNGDLQDIALFNKALTQFEVRLIREVGLGLYFRSTSTALGEVLDHCGWPAGLRNIATNTTGNALAYWTDDANPLSVAQQIATTEQGRFFVSGDGNVTLLARYSHQLDTTGNTVQATFSDDGAGVGYQDVGYNYDDVQVRNDISVTSPGGSAHVEDATSITDYGRQTATVATYLPTLASAEQMATGLIGWRKDPQVRSLPLTATLTDTAQFASLLGLELGERVKFEITPPGMGSQSAQELILEQMDWDISNALWELTVQGSPIPPDVFILDSSLLDGADVLGF